MSKKINDQKECKKEHRKIFNSFIENKINNSDHYTFGSINPPRKYLVESLDIETFWDLYCDAIYFDKMSSFTITEKPETFISVLGDIDIKIDTGSQEFKNKFPNFKFGESNFKYSDTHIQKIVRIYKNVLKTIIKEDKDSKISTDEKLICCVLEKTKIKYENGIIKFGLHLHFPFTFIDKNEQDIHLTPRLKEAFKEQKIMEDIGVLNPEKLIDETCTNKQWMLYGSKKHHTLEAYKLTKIYDSDMKLMTIDKAFKYYKLYNIHGEPISFTKNYEYYIPRIFSINSQHREITRLKTDLECLVRKKLKKAKDCIDDVYSGISVNDALKQAESLLKLINSSRADEYQSWIQIGMAMFTIGNGCVEALNMWIEFSKKTAKKGYFSESGCISRWKGFINGAVTMGTIRYYAKLDNPVEYEKEMETAQKKRLSDSIKGGHTDLARILFEEEGRTNVCASIKDDLWYEFKEHGWSASEKGVTIFMKITNVLVKKFTKMGRKLYRQLEKEDDEEDIKAMQEKQKQITKLVGNLKSAPFIKNVMEICRKYFYRPNFKKLLDSNPDLIRCKNGVLDLKSMIFRDGEPEDMLSLSTNIEYKEFKDDSPEVHSLSDFYDKIYPDSDLKQYMLEYDANLLKGGNTNKVILIASGDGDNGKSVKMDLTRLMLGEYFETLPTSVVTGKQTQSSHHTAELDDLWGVRFLVLNEPNRKDVFNVGVFKGLTGNDQLYVRGMREKKTKLIPLFKVAVICNKLPKLPADEEAIWNRIDVLPHESWFPKNPVDCPEDPDEQKKKKIFPRDNFFNEKLPGLAQVALWNCFEVYKRMTIYGRTPKPEKVMEASRKYKKNNDIFVQFKEDTLHKDEESKISIKDCYLLFKNWYKESCPNLLALMPNMADFEDDMQKRLGIPVNKKWIGWREKEDKDLEVEGKVLILREDDLDKVKKGSREKSVKDILSK